MTFRIPSSGGGPDISLCSFNIGIDDAHKNIIKLFSISVSNEILYTVSITSRIRRKVVMNKRKGTGPSGVVIERLWALKVAAAYVDVRSDPGVGVNSTFVFKQLFLVGKDCTVTLLANVNVGLLADLHICKVDVVLMHGCDVLDEA